MYAVRCPSEWEVKVSLDFDIDLAWWTQDGRVNVSWRGVGRSGIGQQYTRLKGGWENGTELAGRAPGAGEAKFILLLAAELPLGLAVGLRDGFMHHARMDEWGAREWNEYLQEELARRFKGELARDKFFLESLGPARLIWTREKGMTREGRAIQREMGERISPWGEPQAEQVGRPTAEQGAHFDRGGLDRCGLKLRVIAGSASRLVDALAGRSLLAAELQQLLAERLPELAPAWRSAAQYAHLQGRVQLTAGVAPAAARHSRAPLRGRARPPRCRRCGSEAFRCTPCGSCGLSSCAYCEACLALGRSRSCALLLRGSACAVPSPPSPMGGGDGTAGPPTGSLLDRWGLSPAQRAAAGEALRFLAEPQEAGGRGGMRVPLPRNAAPHGGGLPAGKAAAHARIPRFLLWAVTGAGKTEMIFPLIQYALDRGGTVLVATPRRDVVLELAPRIAKAFPDEPAAVLYGGSVQRWERARLYLATTHQLLRFQEAFDLVIIDELDAFPYHNDPMLAFAAEASCKPGGRFIYLSATPPLSLQREIRQGRLAHAKVPARFHGYPLPVPRRVAMSSVAEAVRRQRLPGSLLQPLNESILRGAQIFMFVSRIRHIDPFVAMLRRRFSALSIEGTSSQDEQRSDKVLNFRSGEIRILVTTTILERGVTVPKSDVYILDADSELFDEASLVQMAGRAGRSKDDPAGIVVFASPEWTRSQHGAVKQIKAMNKIALKKGFLRQADSKAGQPR
ncbi:DEAD/DEAH box helicase [Paenibacillus woosongensis]|nr:helicase-related protein [Paenibacillus woosongensis]